MHDGTLCRDWSPDDVVRVAHVDDGDLLGPVDLFADANEPVRLEGQRREPDRAGLDIERRELRGIDSCQQLYRVLFASLAPIQYGGLARRACRRRTRDEGCRVRDSGTAALRM